jgi:short-subunit dehydrogenase
MENFMHKESFSFLQYGKWALVTGASSGIGKAFAFRAARDGVNVVLVSNDNNALIDTEKEIKAVASVDLIVCCCDLACSDVVDKIREKIGNTHIDILISNASMGSIGPFYSRELAFYEEMLSVNMNAYLRLVYSFLAPMKEKNAGLLLLVSSVNAYSPVANSAVYTATKAFELYLGEALWKELQFEESKVTCFTLCASSTRTNFQQKARARVVPWAWEPEAVVEQGVRSIGKRSSLAIGWRGKAYYYISKFLPRKFGIAFSTWAINMNLKKDYAGKRIAQGSK